MSKKLAKKLIVILSCLLPVAVFADDIGPQQQLSERSPAVPIPGVICSGKHLTVGLNEGGGFGVGTQFSRPWAGFQFPPGDQYESLAIWYWGEGWKLSYKEKEKDEIVDTTVWWQPEMGWPPAPGAGFAPVSAKLLRDDDQECRYQVIVKTTDGKVKLAFDFNFRKAYPSVVVTTKVMNISKQRIFDVVYARAADFDIHTNTNNGWSSNDSGAFACGNNPTEETPLVMMGISGYDLKDNERPKTWDARVMYTEENAWDDYSIRGPGSAVNKNRVPYFSDGFGSVHYKLESLKPKQFKKMATVYSAAYTNNCPR